MPDSYETLHLCLDPIDNDAAADPDADVLASVGELALGTAPCLADTDADTMLDGYEAARSCLDPLVADAAGDPDSDALASAVEHGIATEPCIADTDADGCGDGRELGLNETSGGRRDPLNQWDFYDVNGSRKVDAVDIGLVRAHLNINGPVPPDDAVYDRRVGPAPWAPGPPDGRINAIDIALVRASFGHTCV
jgi:hypothetical protein